MPFYSHPRYPALSEFLNEPDFHDNCAFGLPFSMRRNGMKAWCGYVGVPKSHSLWGKDYNDRVPVPNKDSIYIGGQSPVTLLLEAFSEDDSTASLSLLLNCPGSVTWAQPRVPWGGLPNYWYFGFDCGHYNDLTPRQIIQEMAGDCYIHPGVYRNFAFTENACRHLAEQLSEF